jgi:dipeptidase D
MEKMISQLTPTTVWKNFEEICKIPRPSRKEERIIEFVEQYAAKHHLSCKKDDVGNILISKPASPGYENRKKVILQSHLDMVCEKNRGVVHDFEKDPIKPYIDGEWVRAKGTTLGADCGIGIAAQLSVLSNPDLKHGSLECLFTVDEETGLTGAFALKPGFLDGEILINLDSEDEGELFIGCAGGIETVAKINLQLQEIPNGAFPLEIKVSGLKGGHSGDDINKGRGNAIKILVRILWDVYHKYGIKLAAIDGGNLHNAIPREASSLFLVKKGYKENLVAQFNILAHEIKNEFSITEPDLKIELSSVEMPEQVMGDSTTEKLIYTLYACPHGVVSMSFRMPGLVETSTNLASVKLKENNIIEITTSQRSDQESSKRDIMSIVETVFLLGGASVEHSEGYPGWTPNRDSQILKITEKAYLSLFGKQPVVRSIHAGLECGLFLSKYPGLDMVSFGPTLRDVHSPDERINIETVDKFWKLLIAVLDTIPAKG